ncbi:MAG TPA: tetratricopeptide repeat protein, partial [Bacteroidia bacterium]|nr:tetratricopeptide repeat protein [Bacteroidia bacterium]
MRISLAFFLLLISAALHSQNENEALLLHQLSAAKDTARIRLLDELSRYYYEIGAVSLSDSFASVELNEAKKRGDDRLTAIAILRHGQAMDSRGQFDSANAVYDAAIEKLDTNSDRKEYAQALLYKANAFYFKGNTAQAQNLYYRSLVIREAISDSMGMASSMMGMALVLSDIGQKEKSLDYNLQALGILQRQGELKTVSWLYNNIGTNYADMKRNDEALAVFAKSLALKKQLNDRYGISTTYNNIGDIFLEEGRYDSALFYFRMGYNIRRKIDDQHELANSCKLMGMAYLQMNLPDSALPFLDSAQTIGERSGSWDVLKSVYENLALLYAGRGDFRSAFDYEKKFMTARDSVLSEETSRQVNELNARYEDEKKEHQLALKDAEISRGNAFRNLLFGIAALLVVLAVALFTGYRRKRRTSEILAQKNGEIESQKQLVEEKNRDITDSITYAR